MTNKVRFDYKKGLETCFVAPDKGAKERYGLFVRFGIECSKVRDAATGKLSGFSNELLDGNPDKSNSNLVVIDDLCDGGGTFCGVADMLKEYNPKETTLMIIHAVNYAGILNVAKRFTNVYITNSYADYDNGEYELPPNVHVVKVPF
jgi:ribose-phosphate pyrophosphokinase